MPAVRAASSEPINVWLFAILCGLADIIQLKFNLMYILQKTLKCDCQCGNGLYSKQRCLLCLRRFYFIVSI